MSGHSKWSQIKRQKGAADAKRAVAFSKLANAVSLAARSGADPETNFQLRLAIDKAREANMPKENIARAIDKAQGAGGGTGFEEVIFEAYGPGGIAFLIEGATDNHNRTIGEIRAALNKFGGKLAESGSVKFLFEQKGLLRFTLEGAPEELELAAIEADAEDFQAHGSEVAVYTKHDELDKVRQKLASQGYAAQEMSLVWEPTSTILIEDPKIADQLVGLAEVLEDLDDVTRVASNFEIAEGSIA